MGAIVGSAQQYVTLAATPARNPPSGAVLLYFKTDGNLYKKDSTGVESLVSSGGGVAAATDSATAPASPVDGQLWYDPTDNTAPTSTAVGLTGNQTINGYKTFQGDAGGPGLNANPGAGSISQIWQNAAGATTAWANSDGSLAMPYENLITDYVATQPVSPSSGLLLFNRYRARRLPAFVGPTGQDSQLQPALFSNRIATLQAINNSATQQLLGLAVTNIATPTAVANAGTNFYSSMVRQRYTTSTTAGTGAGTRSASAQWMLSSTANKGGFFFVCRFGLATAATGTRGFIGLSTTTGAYPAGSDPRGLLNQIGFAWNAADTTIYFHNAAGTAQAGTNLGTNFPSNNAATYFYEVRLFSPSGNDTAMQGVWWSIHRLNDGVITTGGPVTTNLPANDTLLTAHVNYSNGTLAAAHSIDIQSLYIETDN